MSDFPFKNRPSWNLDSFETNALKEFRAGNLQPVVSVTGIFTREVRFVTPIKMSQLGCVNCHNSHSESMKRDWKIGDIRGFQEVTIRQPLAVNILSFKYMSLYFIFTILTGIIVISWQRRQARLVAHINLQLLEASQLTSESINYASRIQVGLLPNAVQLNSELKSIDVLWRPRDIIGGDVYWRSDLAGPQQPFTLGLIDCTGHGVPGALMSSLVLTSLKRIYSKESSISPGAALAQLGNLVRQALNQDVETSTSNDGFDAGFCEVNPQTGVITFSGARTNLFIIPGSDQEVRRIKGSNEALGYKGNQPYEPLNEQVFSADGQNLFCMVSDGLIDQPGGPDNIAFGPKRMMAVMAQQRGTDASTLIKAIETAVELWRGVQLQRDDYSAIAFEV